MTALLQIKRKRNKHPDICMERDWVKVYESEKEIQIEMARQILEENTIEAVVINKKDRAYGFGVFELYCLRDYVILVKQLLKDL